MFLKHSISSSEYYSWLAYFDYIRCLFNLDKQTEVLEGLWEAIEYCGGFIPLNKVCIVHPKPSRLKVKLNRNRAEILHGEGEPAIYYCKDFQLWAHEGVRLDNPRYHCHPDIWQPEWILDERNAEIRRVIFQALGTTNIFNELNSDLIDIYSSTREGKYELHCIPADINDYYILTMTCPSTGMLHAHRVPPNCRTARDAIKWINHGIDPESFLDVG